MSLTKLKKTSNNKNGYIAPKPANRYQNGPQSFASPQSLLKFEAVSKMLQLISETGEGMCRKRSD